MATDPLAADPPGAGRRFDPDRKDRILDAAIGVIARQGALGATSRAIAAAADVPLGSVTYHFATLDELRAQAFQRHATRMSEEYARRFDDVTDTAAFVDAVVDLICDDAGAGTQDWSVAYELYLAALKDPALRTLTDGWMRTSRTVLRRFVDADTARGLDALIEGLVLHKILSTEPMPRSVIRGAIEHLVAGSSRGARA